MSTDFLRLFRRLISIPSVSSAHPDIDQSNLMVIELLAETFSALGFACDIIPVPGLHPKANLIATLGSGPGGLVLSGHTDTVPFDESLWQTNPLQATEKDGRLYGLGSTDMKGFFAVVQEAVRDFVAMPLQQPLIILATADEESSMQGAFVLAELGRPRARYAVIGEPTGLKPVIGHKGIMMETIRIQGRSGHSSNPALGHNALEAMHEVLGELLAFRQQLQAAYRNPHFAIEVPTLNLGVIHGGDNPNRICGHCALEFDLRLLPGMANDLVREDIRALLHPIAERHQVAIELSPLFPGIPPFANPHSELAAIASKLTGHAPEVVAFGTEGPFLQQLGMDTIILGPGSIDLAHQPNEYLALNQVQPCIDILQNLIRRFCL
ncbi:MAG: acetylornithine deacetylase [Pseudomonadales bacterium]|nr:acetylornithine deacetylase [Pseudomonadales bacterium]